MDEIEPVAFHPADGTPGAAEELGIAVVEVVQIAPQLGFGGSGAAQCLAEESRVCNDAPTDHDAGKGGKFRFQRMELPCGGDITVVADRRLALGQGGGKGFPVGLPAVELAHDTGMNGQFRDGVAVIDCKDGRKFLRFLHAQPGLDRDGALCMRENSFQKGVQFGRVPQHSGTLALGGNRSGGAAEVQVDLRITQLPQLADHPGSQLAILGQQLRDNGHAGVGLRGQFRHLLFDENAVFRRGQKGRVIAGRAACPAEPFLVGLPPHPVGEPLHGGNVVVHVIRSN